MGMGRGRHRLSGRRQRDGQTATVAAYVLSELEERAWSQRQLAYRMDVPLRDVEDLIRGALVTTRLAAGLAQAFGANAELYLDIDLKRLEREAKRPW